MPQMHIDTIPIWDAFNEMDECPLCRLEKRCETQFLEIALGGALMEPDIRIKTNESGFCRPHMALLFEGENKLGLALMLDTHLRDYMESLKAQVDAMQKQLEAEKGKNVLSKTASGIAKSSPFFKELDKTLEHVHGRSGSCFICQRIESTMQRYLETVLHLYKSDEKFKELFLSSKGFCMHHFAGLLGCAKQHLGGQVRLEFVEGLTTLQQKQLARIEEELEWFTLKFDYRNSDKPWGNSKDAVERSMNKLQGRVIDLDKRQE